MTNIFHITSINNLSSILQEGCLWCDGIVSERQLSHTNIAHQHIKERRAQKSVPCPPGGMLSDYVPFSLAPRSPMLYSIYRGNIEGYLEGQTPVVHLVASAETVQNAGLPFVFSDGHAEMDISRFFNDLNDLDQIDWEIMNARYWRDTIADNDRKRRRQAEFLIYRALPFTLIERIGVINQHMVSQVRKVLDSHVSKYNPTIEILPSWYY